MQILGRFWSEKCQKNEKSKKKFRIGEVSGALVYTNEVDPINNLKVSRWQRKFCFTKFFVKPEREYLLYSQYQQGQL